MPIDGSKYGRARMRWLLVLIVLLAVMPVFVLYLSRLHSSSELALEEARWRAATLAQDGATAQREIVLQARQLLEILSRVPAIREITPDCDRFTNWVHNNRQWVALIFVTDITGKAKCSSLESASTLFVGDRPYFQEAITTGYLAVSDVVIGKVTGRPVVVMALPLFDSSGKLTNVVALGVDLLWINQLASAASAKYGGIVLAIDHNSRVIAMQPYAPEGWKPGEVFDNPLVRSVLDDSPSTVFEADDLVGERRIFGVARLGDGNMTIAVGLKRNEVLDPINRDFLINLLLLILVAATSIGLSLTAAEFGLLRGVRMLKAAALRLKAGKIGLRVKLPAFVAAELHDLAATYNGMTAEFERLAYLDRLTGLPNRRYLERRLVERNDQGDISINRRQAVLAIDLDGFKPVNDTYGHAVGDKVLAAVARHIGSIVDERGVVARVGGDEFIAIIPLGAEDGRYTASAIAEDIRCGLKQPVKVEGISFSVGCSIGIALVPEDASSLVNALVVADAALYEAKRMGRDRVIVNAPPLAAEGLGEAETRKPQWMMVPEENRNL